MLKITYIFVIKALGISQKQFADLPFWQKTEYFKKIQEFKDSAKKAYVSQKHRTTKAAMREFLDLYQPKEYYLSTTEGNNYRDDSLEIWYK